jgi:hypothetical protein
MQSCTIKDRAIDAGDCNGDGENKIEPLRLGYRRWNGNAVIAGGLRVGGGGTTYCYELSI